jgi:hypothetical protein
MKETTDELSIFYSWQSDLPNKTNRGLIEDGLKRAIRNIGRSPENALTAVLDRDTFEVSGTPDISATIFEKIAIAAVFVCDISIVNGKHIEAGDRPTPNPNVLIELGYAVRCLGWERVVCVCNTAFGLPEQLPFDLRGRRVLTYSTPDAPSGDPHPARAEERQKLVEKLQDALRSSLMAAEIARVPTADERRSALIAGQVLHAISLLLAMLRPFVRSIISKEEEERAFGALNSATPQNASTTLADAVIKALQVAPLIEANLANGSQSWVEFLTSEFARFQSEISNIQARFGVTADAELTEHIELLRIGAYNAFMIFGAWQTFPEFYREGLTREDYLSFVRIILVQVVSTLVLCKRFQERVTHNSQ